MYHTLILQTKEEMLAELPIIQQLYPNYTIEIYGTLLDAMLPNNYKQLVVKDDNKTIGLSGFWIGTKLWCGKYLELDNVVVHENFRSKGIGKIINETLEEIAIETNCNMLALDAYTDNFAAQKFYMNHGYVPRGFHFIKKLK